MTETPPARARSVKDLPLDQHPLQLENFQGPLDLLLHLIREHEVDVTDVALGQVCDQYVAALDAMKALDIEVAGDFLVIAATLMLIKSRVLLPREEVDLEAELDPGDELLSQLLEYRKYKALAFELGERAKDRGQRRTQGLRDKPLEEERTLEEIQVWDLVAYYARLSEELGLRRRFDTMDHERPLREFLHGVVARLHERDAWDFKDLVLAEGPETLFPVFMSVLELVRTGQVDVDQPTRGVIVVKLRQDRDETRLAALLGGGMDEDEEGDGEGDPDADAGATKAGADADDATDPEASALTGGAPTNRLPDDESPRVA